jgi:hypothetical protein
LAVTSNGFDAGDDRGGRVCGVRVRPPRRRLLGTAKERRTWRGKIEQEKSQKTKVLTFEVEVG